NKCDQTFQENNNNILLSIFANILLISIDYKKGKLNIIESLESIYDSSIGFYIGMQDKDDKKELIYSKEFYNKYLAQESPVSRYIKMYKSIGEYIFTGHLDIEVLKQEILEKHYKTENKEEVAVNVLYFYEDVELDRLRECVEIVIKGIEEAYYSPKLYPGIYKLLIEFIDKKYIEKNKTELYKIFDYGLDNGLNKHEMPLHEARLNRYFENECEDENYKKLVCKIKDKRVEIIKSQKEALFTEFLDVLKGKDEEKLLQCFSKLESEKNFFVAIDQEKFSSEIIYMPNKGISMFGKLLQDKYLRISNARDFYSHEVEEIEAFTLKVEDKLKEAAIDPLKKDLVLRLIENLRKVKAHVSRLEVE
ncbi:hypothetical protein, partial [Bacillus cereus group sp. BceL203]